jgi:hypothetical protein
MSDAPAASLTVRLENRMPVELGAFTQGMQALASLYARHAAAEGEQVNGEEVRLHIKKVESGSIIVDLVAMGATLAPLLEQARSVVSFAKDVKALYDFAQGKAKELPPGMDRTDIRLGRDFLGIAARDPQSNIQVSAAEGAVVTVNVVSLTGLEAAGIQHRLDHILSQEKMPANGIHQGALFYWRQVKEGDGRTGNRGIIEAITPKPIKTRFSDPTIQQEMMEDALFKRAYVVDVEVQTIGGVPSLYTILRVIETLDRD